MREININAPLRDYVEMLNYEVKRYEDLLHTVNREDNPMSDEEWADSWEYFSNLYEEAKVKFDFIKELITESYINEEEKSSPYQWVLDYDRLKMFIWNPEEEEYNWERDETKEEQYSDSLARFYGVDDNIATKGHSTDYLAKETTFQVTENCNMACTYCYQHNKKPNVMTFDIAKTYLDMLFDNDPKISSYYDSSKMIGATFDFIGGEPWLQVGLIDQISNYIITELFRRKHKWAIRFMFSICSNGLLQDLPEVQKYLRKHKNHLCYNVSIDGNKKLHDTCRLDKEGCGTYDRAFAAAMQWKNEIGGHPTTKMTISPFNVPYLYDSVVDIINNGGYKHVNLNCVMEEGWEKSHATELYWQLHKIADYLSDKGIINDVSLSIFDEIKGCPYSELSHGNMNPCGGTGSMLAIDWKGDIYPCLRYMENSISSDVREPYIIGNVWDGVNVLSKHKSKVDYLKSITRDSQSPEKCRKCPISSLCPNCNGYAYEYNGDPGKRTVFVCDVAKAESLINVYYWKLRGKDLKVKCPKDWALEIIDEDEYNKLLNMEVVKQ